jgi:excisionase family DNA binding protein
MRTVRMPPTERLAVSVREAAALLSISDAHAYRMAEHGDLGAVRLGGRWIVPLTRLERLLDPLRMPEGD